MDFPALQDVDFSVVSAQMKYTLKNFGSLIFNVASFAFAGDSLFLIVSMILSISVNAINKPSKI